MRDLLNWLTKEIIDIECIIDEYEDYDLPIPDNLHITLSKYKLLKNTLETSSEIIEIINNNIKNIRPEFIDGFISGNSLIGIANADLERLGELLNWINKK